METGQISKPLNHFGLGNGGAGVRAVGRWPLVPAEAFTWKLAKSLYHLNPSG